MKAGAQSPNALPVMPMWAPRGLQPLLRVRGVVTTVPSHRRPSERDLIARRWALGRAGYVRGEFHRQSVSRRDRIAAKAPRNPRFFLQL